MAAPKPARIVNRLPQFVAQVEQRAICSLDEHCSTKPLALARAVLALTRSASDDSRTVLLLRLAAQRDDPFVISEHERNKSGRRSHSRANETCAARIHAHDGSRGRRETPAPSPFNLSVHFYSQKRTASPPPNRTESPLDKTPAPPQRKARNQRGRTRHADRSQRRTRTYHLPCTRLFLCGIAGIVHVRIAPA